MNPARPAEYVAPEGWVQVGLWCDDCKKLRRVDGSSLRDEPWEYGAAWSRCGVDYSPNWSHFNVRPVFMPPALTDGQVSDPKGGE